MSRSDEWEARIRRAQQLVARTPALAEVLRFYAVVAAAQQRVRVSWAVGRPADGSPGSGTSQSAMEPGRSASADAPWCDVDPDLAARACPAFLASVVDAAPEGVRTVLARGQATAVTDWAVAIRGYLDRRGEPDDATAPAVAFVVEAVVQAIVGHARADEASADAPTDASGAAVASRCPRCGAPPLVGVLREVGHGARRHLVCAVCLHEWTWLRATCAACGEPRADALAVFGAPDRTEVRIEACQSCRTYLKTLDATRDPGVVPPVDDLATAALDVWARGQGYVRLRANLLRL